MFEVKSEKLKVNVNVIVLKTMQRYDIRQGRFKVTQGSGRFRRLNVDGKLFADEADNLRRQHLHVGLQTHRLQLLPERPQPVHQRLYADAGLHGQL